MAEAAWHTALAYAVTGRDLALGLQARPDPAGLLAELRARGLEPDQQPRVIPARLRAGLGAAQLAAALTELRRLARVDGLEPRTPAPGRRLGEPERRLLADRPPHWA
ncbi:hypothetical protein [Granulicoccus phenolivorans]|uniref:hypothetical protein n=1 Tax=Granulicoccus phenolivorans TaxID=266854 RepID=UPI0003FD3DA2|nr:hypothetical protein [Granulicoccus phenolivorans]